MNRREYVLGLAADALSSRSAHAQGFPTRSLIMSNGYPPGGSTDVAARLMVEGTGPAA
ncbi:hypothetical protein [Bosea sp. NPDC055594]